MKCGRNNSILFGSRMTLNDPVSFKLSCAVIHALVSSVERTGKGNVLLKKSCSCRGKQAQYSHSSLNVLVLLRHMNRRLPLSVCVCFMLALSALNMKVNNGWIIVIACDVTFIHVKSRCGGGERRCDHKVLVEKYPKKVLFTEQSQHGHIHHSDPQETSQ